MATHDDAKPLIDKPFTTGDPATVRRESARRTRRSFLAGSIAAAAGYGVFRAIDRSAPIGRLQSGLRHVIDFDASVVRTVFGERGLAPEYPVSRAQPLRLNGTVGLDANLDLDHWRLQLAGVANPERSPLYARDVTAWEYRYLGAAAGQPGEDLKSAPKPAPKPNTLNPTGAVDSPAGAALAAHIEAMLKAAEKPQTKRTVGTAEAGASASGLDIGTPGLLLAMSDLQQLPTVSFCTEFKCVEGWSQITQWQGHRLRDLIDLYPPAPVNGRLPRYVYMETPDGDYYCGFDMKAALHPQSLLVTAMSGQPLTQEHGAPLRLHMPIKYGYKQIKRIGLIAYTDVKPDDYWMKLGYDWYAGL
jgi:hypothetical protein